jgi:hypothetical protein
MTRNQLFWGVPSTVDSPAWLERARCLVVRVAPSVLSVLPVTVVGALRLHGSEPGPSLRFRSLPLEGSRREFPQVGRVVRAGRCFRWCCRRRRCGRGPHGCCAGLAGRAPSQLGAKQWSSSPTLLSSELCGARCRCSAWSSSWGPPWCGAHRCVAAGSTAVLPRGPTRSSREFPQVGRVVGGCRVLPRGLVVGSHDPVLVWLSGEGVAGFAGSRGNASHLAPPAGSSSGFGRRRPRFRLKLLILIFTWRG